MAVVRYREALNQALREEMRRDERVFGMGVGAAMTGLRPVVELMTINFSLLAMDQIVNHMATIHYMFGGQAKVPMVVRMPQGAGHQLGPTHSHCFEALYLHVPGMLVAVPSTAADAKGLLKSAIRDDNPVVFIEHEYLYGQRGDVPDDEDHTVDFGQAAIRREGEDVTLVGISRMAVTAEKAAGVLADEHGVQAEVIDPRTLRPLDLDTILASVRKTNRCVIVEEGWPHGGVGANLAALVQEQAFDDLDAPVGRVTGADVPMPYSKPLEQIAFPHEPQVVQAGAGVGDLVARRAPDLLHPDDRAALRARWRELLAGVCEAAEIEVRIGVAERRWYLVSLVADREAELVYLIGKDVDESREAIERFRSAFENSGVGMTIATLDGRFVRVNPAFARMVGRTVDELAGTPVAEITHPDDLAADREGFAALMADPGTIVEREKRYLRPDGSEVLTAVSVSAIGGADGAGRYLIAQMVDITQQRAAETALADSERLFRTLAVASPAGIFSAAFDGRMLYANDRLAEIFGMDRDETAGAQWLDRVE